MIPRRSLVVFHLAVFCNFAPLGLLFVSALDPRRPWLPVVANLFVSGLIAVSWAASFAISRWFIAAIVLSNGAMVLLNSVFDDSPVGIGRAEFSLTSLVLIAAIVVGYVLFIVFIAGQGRTTMRLMTEMSLAQNIHATLVPPVRFSGGRIEALGRSLPSAEMGGDLVDVVDRGETIDVFLADVSGHGVQAGVVMGMLKSAIRMSQRREQDLAALLRDLNDVLEGTTSAELYATLVGMRIHRTGRLEYALAGHSAILHHRAADAQLARLGGRSLPLGLFAGKDYRTDTVQLGSGDLLAVYTDGLNETADASDAELGHDAIERVLAEGANHPLEETLRAVFERAEAHGKQTDDRTLLLIRYR